MKKCISILILLALTITGAFAQIQMSAGGGLLFDYGYDGGVEWEYLDGTPDGKGRTGDWFKLISLSIGGYGFFDFTYGEIDVSFSYGSLSDCDNDLGSILRLGFSLLGKYPIAVGPVTVFPLLGIDYRVVLSWTYDGTGKQDYGSAYDDPGNLSQLGILAGAGLDYDLTDTLYLRAEAMFHLRFPGEIWDLYAKQNESWLKTETTFGMGPRIKVGLGYRF